MRHVYILVKSKDVPNLSRDGAAVRGWWAGGVGHPGGGHQSCTRQHHVGDPLLNGRTVTRNGVDILQVRILLRRSSNIECWGKII